MASVLITGGTGLVGSALSRLLLANGYDVIILSRNPIETASRFDVESERRDFRHNGKIFFSKWDIGKKKIDAEAIRAADHIVHLAGAGVAAQRWSEARKKEIVESRTHSSDLLVQTLRDNRNKVRTVLSASAIGWYGPDKGRAFTEADPSAGDFLGHTCKLWEESIDPMTALGKRLVKLRSGIVLSTKGGALAEFRKPIRLGVAAVLGDGDQVMSWVHIDDLCQAFLHALENIQVNGVYNVVAPLPVDNRTLTLSLARHMNGRRFLKVRVPASFLKTALGEMSTEVLKSARVDGTKLTTTGFHYAFPDIESALTDLVGR
jgi:uncharacterized protein (TIGR01777 family)